MQTLSQKLQWLVHTLYRQKYWDTPFFRTEKCTSKSVATTTCTYGYSHFRHFQNCSNRDGNTVFKYMNYVPMFVVATDLEVHFSVLKKGLSQYFCPYSVCKSHWCLVMSFWLKVCIYSHTRGVKLGLGLGFMQTSQVLPHWLNQSFSSWTLSYTQRHCHVRIEKSPVQTVAIILEAHNFLEYHYML